ncbi:MAG: 4Fe-4S binding protein [Spirochaetales bacterium]|nr:4Fe-4S binding protein [Spirochaetales bacterium]
MIYNNIIHIKRDVLYRTIKSIVTKDFATLNKIPYEIAPRDSENKRCCIHKDRAVLKYRVMAALGHSVEDEKDELMQLSDYGFKTMGSTKFDNRNLTVIHDACRSCKLGSHYISDVCAGCVARPCTSICPKGAIKVRDGRAKIDTNLCTNCGKCTDVCSYKAIVKVPVPCEISCPVNALKKNDLGIATIDSEICINCGKCIKTCPFGAIAEKSQIVYVLNELREKKTINALIAPSIAGQFPGTINQIRETILTLGYSNVVDVAEFAALVAQEEAEEYLHKKTDILTSSCCPAFIECVKKHAHGVEPYVSKTLSPMAMAGKDLKEKNPQCINVFIGPCLAKKSEAYKSEYIDYVISFEELGAHVMAMDIDVLQFESMGKYDKIGYGFASSGGVLKGVTQNLRDNGVWINGEKIDGIDKKQVSQFKVFNKLKKPYEFLEVMACEGGCINGPGVIVNPVISKKELDKIKS